MAGPVLKILYNGGTEIQDHVIYESASFDSQMASIPGTFEFLVKDEDRTLSFVTGKRIEVTLDDVPLWGGFITQVGRKFAFPVVNTVTRSTSAVRERLWQIRGVDYNILLDKRIVRDTDDYLHNIPAFSIGAYDDTVVTTLLASYLDLPPWLTQHVERTALVNPEHVGEWVSQGSTWRAQLNSFASIDGQVFYIDAGGEFIWRAAESGGAAWGFSDTPADLEGTWVGFRELEATEDGSGMVNDAFVWGGDEFTGIDAAGSGGGATIFYRYEDPVSEAAHDRWQWAETHFGDVRYANMGQITRRAERIVDGPPGATTLEGMSGLTVPQWQVRLSWFDNDVPDQDYLRPGQLVNMTFAVLGDESGPLTLTLPLRQVRLSFPVLQLDPADPTLSAPAVRFDGYFGIQLDDPFTLWQAVINATAQTRAGLSTATNDSAQTSYGSLGQFVPTPSADGTTTVFAIKFGYMTGSAAVYQDGLRLARGNTPGENDYQETDPLTGEITFTTAPPSGAKLYVECRTLVGAE